MVVKRDVVILCCDVLTMYSMRINHLGYEVLKMRSKWKVSHTLEGMRELNR